MVAARINQILSKIKEIQIYKKLCQVSLESIPVSSRAWD